MSFSAPNPTTILHWLVGNYPFQVLSSRARKFFGFQGESVFQTTLGYMYNIWHQTFKPNTPIPRNTRLSYFKKWLTVLAGELFHTLRSSDLKCCPTLLLKQICKKKGGINQPYQKPEHTPPLLFFFTSYKSG